MESKVHEYHSKLCSEIGHRLAGTENDRLAADYIETTFKTLGYITKRQVYECPTWDHYHSAVITQDGYEITHPEGGASMFSLPCNLSGELLYIDTLSLLEQSELTGKICVIGGELRNSPIRTNRNPIIIKLEEKNPLAVIFIDPLENGYVTKVVRDPQFMIPVCAVSGKAGRLLLKGKTASIVIDAKRYLSQSFNIIASDKSNIDKKIRITAHYDTSANSRGAADNGSGISAVLEVARRFVDMDFGLEFIAFSAEEYAMLGSGNYEIHFEEDIKNTRFTINVDVVGTINSRHIIYLNGQDDRLDEVVLKAGSSHEIIRDKMPGISDHEVFRRKQIPVVFFNDKPEISYWDTSLDTADKISFDKIEDSVHAIAEIIRMSK